jgi:hypothetical protein
MKGPVEDPGQFVPRLKAMGLSSKAISRVSGMTENAIAVRLSRIKAAAAEKPAKVKKSRGMAATDDTREHGTS